MKRVLNTAQQAAVGTGGARLRPRHWRLAWCLWSRTLYPLLLTLALLADASTASGSSSAARPAPPRPDGADAKPPPEVVKRAAQHFDDGLRFVSEGAYALAVREFTRAYELLPHHSVLYNLGLAYVALGRPKQAVESFENYLVRGGDALAPSQMDAARTKIREQRALLGTILVHVEPAAARVAVNGVPTPNEVPVEVTAGSHVVHAELDGYSVAKRTLEVQPGTTTELHMTLLPHRRLTVECPLPDVSVSLAGQSLGTTSGTAPLDVLVPHGADELVLERRGYHPQTVSLEPSTVELRCALTPVEQRSVLWVRTEPGALLFVDGKPFQNGSALSSGRHSVLVKRVGYAARQAVVRLPATGKLSIEMRLRPAEGLQRAQDARAARVRTAGYWLAGSGVFLGAVAGGIHLHNNARYDRWRERRQALPKDPQTAADRQAVNELEEVQQSIETWDTRALILASTGGALALSGIVAYLTGGTSEPSRVAIAAAPHALWIRASF